MLEINTSLAQFFDIPFFSLFNSTSVAVIVFSGFILILYIAYTLVLSYHWKVYGMDKRAIVVANLVYFAVSLPLLTIFAFSAVILI
jgi:hypothetical protein